MHPVVEQTRQTIALSPARTLVGFPGKDGTPALLSRIQELRANYILTQSPWLTLSQEAERHREVDLDARSVHVAVELRGQILAAIRITARPFEMDLLEHAPDAGQTSFDGHLELSRLAVSCDSPPNPLLVRQLLLSCGLIAIDEFDAEGLVALCRKDRLRLFSKFGLKPTGRAPFLLAERNHGIYWAVSGTIPEILQATRLLQRREAKIQGRLNGLTRGPLSTTTLEEYA